MMRLACSTLLYTKYALTDALQRIAALGFRYVDIAAMEGWATIYPSTLVGCVETAAAQILQECKVVGLTPVALNTAVKGTEAEQDAQFDALVALAQHLQVAVITLGAANKECSLAKDLVRFRRFMDSARQYGVQLTVETHFFTHTEDPAIALRYVQEVPGLGLTLDPGHLAIGPYGDQGIEALLPLVRHVHLRPAGRHGWEEIQVRVDQDCINFPHLLRQLHAVGYDGACSIEYVDSIGTIDHVAETERLREIVEAVLVQL